MPRKRLWSPPSIITAPNNPRIKAKTPATNRSLLLLLFGFNAADSLFFVNIRGMVKNPRTPKKLRIPPRELVKNKAIPIIEAAIMSNRFLSFLTPFPKRNPSVEPSVIFINAAK